MKCIVRWDKDGIEDSIVLEADTLKELQQKAKAEIDKRKLDSNYWAKIVND